ncbi:hypothetical protein PR003_g9308 [Phytophthora rubi]|uniref:Uncharacterized protein n=1 Tax=Phytophthora rubi TaxID=129364 RepID=A0A6A4FUR6_9STRA|nr:hypothetical protein PR002_g9194 [Phytophthora rubi]KAE9342752.1 hypothetical protein PR003_g9308 [Phytophthora rubi]
MGSSGRRHLHLHVTPAIASLLVGDRQSSAKLRQMAARLMYSTCNEDGHAPPSLDTFRRRGGAKGYPWHQAKLVPRKAALFPLKPMTCMHSGRQPHRDNNDALLLMPTF